MLSPERWQLVERLFHEALACPASIRGAFVDSNCGGDEEIRREVASLLAAESIGSGAHVSMAAHAAADWAAALPGDPLIGRDIDGYHVEALLGAGGMGEVYLAEDRALGRRVALKLLPIALLGDEGRVRRFTDEARAASVLNHPNIITVHAVGAVGGRRYIATEFIDGQTVRALIAQGTLPPDAALDIAIQAASALAAAHRAGIVHRDIKPDNIMVRRDGYVKVLDFGLAKLADSTDGLPGHTRAGAVLGTPDYMAPEQAAGGIVDARADLYSLSVVVYEMLAGSLPRELGSGGRRPSGVHTSPLSAHASRVLRRGLATDPAVRYQTASELQRDLEALRRRHAAAPGRTRWLAAACIATAALLAAYAWWTTHARPSGAVNSVVVMPLGVFSDDDAHLAAGMSDAIVTRLASVQELHVPPAAAVKTHEDPFDAARRLGVDAVLTGSVQRDGDRLRVTAQLSHTADRTQIWAARFDEKFTGIFDVEDAIAERIAANFVSNLSERDRVALKRRETQNPEAYDLYLRARDQWALRTQESIRTAIRMYQHAIAIDPNFALAYAGLADAYNLTASGFPPRTREPLARAAAERALALDAESAEAHTAMAFLDYKFDWKWDEADREFRRAIALNPKYALAHHWYGEFLKLRMRPDEATREFRSALDADPLSIPIRYDYIQSLLAAGRVADARAILNDLAAIDPNAQRTFMASADVLTAEGRIDEAVDVTLRGELLSGVPESEVDAQRAVYRSGGQQALKRRRLDQLLSQLKPGAVPGPGVLFATAMTEAYADLGDAEGTLHWLNNATDLDEDAPLLLKMHTFDFVRADAQFIAVQKRVGLWP